MLKPIEKLRTLLRKHAINGYIVPTEDEHQSEYVSEHDNRRSFITGFTGSAGIAMVKQQKAYLWTDARYAIQSKNQVDQNVWDVHVYPHPDKPMSAWMKENVERDTKLGIDPKLVSIDMYRRLEGILEEKEAQLVPITENLVDEIWETQPKRSDSKIFVLDQKYCGEGYPSKIKRIREALGTNNVLITGALDEIAWMLNLRGADIACNPVFFSYVIVTEKDVRLYVNTNKLDEEVKRHLAGGQIVVKEYDEFWKDLTTLDKQSKIQLCPANTNYQIIHTLTTSGHDTIDEGQSIIEALKGIKNETEIEGFRRCHIRDGVALSKFFSWIEGEHAKGNEPTEVEAAEQLLAFRKENPLFKGVSFDTIAGFGPNGAIIHYHAQKETCAKIEKKGMFLCDSGAQYLDGTTDTTRTQYYGTPSSYEKECYTRVLQGFIAIATSTISGTTTGFQLDLLARQPLYSMGLDFMHGTGHGVGHFLNVHEGPHGISFRNTSYRTKVPFCTGRVVSNEPGYYEEGKFGIRIENVIVCQPLETKYSFGGNSYYRFEDLTCVPISTKLVEKSLLSPKELAYLNAYNKWVADNLLASDLLKGDQHEATRQWIKRETAEL